MSTASQSVMRVTSYPGNWALNASLYTADNRIAQNPERTEYRANPSSQDIQGPQVDPQTQRLVPSAHRAATNKETPTQAA